MKTPVAITLIIMGSLLVMTPAVSDYFFQRSLVELMSKPGITSVNLDGKMTDLYRIGCWAAGAMMVGIAVLFSLMDTKPASEREKLAAQAV
jgi:hypothetical protein